MLLLVLAIFQRHFSVETIVALASYIGNSPSLLQIITSQWFPSENSLFYFCRTMSLLLVFLWINHSLCYMHNRQKSCLTCPQMPLVFKCSLQYPAMRKLTFDIAWQLETILSLSWSLSLCDASTDFMVYFLLGILKSPFRYSGNHAWNPSTWVLGAGMSWCLYMYLLY